MHAALEFVGVSHQYDARKTSSDHYAVSNISFAIAPGQVACLLGPSGSGKSTIVRCAAGFELPQAGQITIGGTLMYAAEQAVFVPPHRRKIGVVFQDYALFPHLTVAQNIAFGLHPKHSQFTASTAEDVRARVAAMLELVGLGKFADKSPFELSGGQQQRVALARTLAPAPQFLLLDEPFSGLDPQNRARVRDRTLHILQLAGTACLIITHQPAEAMYMADQLIVIDNGQIVQDDVAAGIYNAPHTLQVANLLGEINSFPTTMTNGCCQTESGQVRIRSSGNGEITIAFRPENVRLVPATQDAEPNDMLRFRLSVLIVRHVGSHVVVHLGGDDPHCGELHFHAHLPARGDAVFLPEAGDEVLLMVEQRDLLAFSQQGYALKST